MALKPVGSGYPSGVHRPFFADSLVLLARVVSRLMPSGLEKPDAEPVQSFFPGRVTLFPQQATSAGAPTPTPAGSPGQFYDFERDLPYFPPTNATAVASPLPAQEPQQLPASDPVLPPQPPPEAPQPDVFDRLRAVYREYYPDKPEGETTRNPLERALGCGWKMAKVIPHGVQILTAGAALALLLALFAFRSKKVIINVIHSEDPAASSLIRDRFAKEMGSKTSMKKLYDRAQYSGKGAKIWKA